ncbi:MAG: D-aminoacylase, partial [Gammaproteobacteria bacterium]|nr:D-aminoacylase [Gemmatimonadota bacterium]NIU73695.1 D-aminoacylase [Gammaproteobacteria bacterium]
MVPLVGYLAVRREVVGWNTSPPDAAESRRIAELIGTYLDQGAWGLSTALEFSPYVSAAEIVQALRQVAGRDGLYFSHLRTQADGITGALEEFLSTARETGVRSVVSHLKVRGARNWGLAP